MGINKIIKRINDLASNLKLSNEWRYEKNKLLIPEEVAKGSTKKVWWKCSVCHHEWLKSIYNRVRSRKSPSCKN